jgi:hypothetical protein
MKAPIDINTLEIDGNPVLSFQARTDEEAQDVVKEDWLRTSKPSRAAAVPYGTAKNYLPRCGALRKLPVRS